MSYIANIIKERLDAKALFKELSVNIHRESKDEIWMYCPNPDHDDSHASCSYNTKEHIWNCLGCDWSGDVFSLVMQIEGISYRNARTFLKKLCGVTGKESDEKHLIKNLEYKTARKKIKDLNVDKETNLPTQFSLDFNKANEQIQRYTRLRRINRLIASKYFIGYCNTGYYKNRLILPIIHFSRIVGFVGRATWQTNKNYDDRYLFESDAPVGSMVWGLFNDHKKQDAVFVEGIFDAIRLRSYRINAYSCLSNNLSEKQIKLIKENFDKRIYIMPDNDAGGDIMRKVFRETLAHSKEIYDCKLKIAEDPDASTREEAWYALKNSRPLTDLPIGQKSYPHIIKTLIRRL